MKKTGTPATAEAQERFMLRAGNATQWQSSAQILKDCAQLIGNFHLAAMDDMLRGEFSMAAVRHLMTGRVFFFMAGLAIENLVKGLLLHRGLVKVDSSQLPGPLNGHGINGKLGKLNIALSADETHMVKKYEVAVSWAGRYPVPVDTRRMPAGTGTITQVRDVADFLAFYNRLNALFEPPKTEAPTGTSPNMTTETRA